MSPQEREQITQAARERGRAERRSQNIPQKIEHPDPLGSLILALLRGDQR